MNQVNTPSQTTPVPAEEPVKIGNPGLIKTVIITVIILAIVILGSIIGYRTLQEKAKQDEINRGKAVVQLLFTIRQNATDFYLKNHSYETWWPNSAILSQATSLDSTIIYRKPDFQNYILYAYIASDQKYFCIDTHQFAEEVATVSDNQKTCSK